MTGRLRSVRRVRQSKAGQADARTRCSFGGWKDRNSRDLPSSFTSLLECSRRRNYRLPNPWLRWGRLVITGPGIRVACHRTVAGGDKFSIEGACARYRTLASLPTAHHAVHNARGLRPNSAGKMGGHRRTNRSQTEAARMRRMASYSQRHLH